LRKVKTVWHHWIAPRKEMTGQLLLAEMAVF